MMKKKRHERMVFVDLDWTYELPNGKVYGPGKGIQVAPEDAAVLRRMAPPARDVSRRDNDNVDSRIGEGYRRPRVSQGKSHT
jgi:hypothetical protein